MKVKDNAIRSIRKSYRFLANKKFYGPECDCDRQSSNDKIFELLSTGAPCLIARFGTVEINCINNYLCIKSDKPFLKKIWEFITDNTHTPWWNVDHFKPMSINAGIFPQGENTAVEFSKRYLNDIPEIDLLGCHQYYEKFMPLKSDLIRVQLEMLYPFYVENPWTRYLKGKKVLVVHPFDTTIQAQYAKRTTLFENEDVLPEFDLITYRAVQTAGGASTKFSTWFEALAFMEKEIASIDFDIAILGCGAYGLPLGASIKRMGKQAIHLGGGTQLLFGIKGRRWMEDYVDYWHYRPGCSIDINYRPLFNDNWVFPSTNERPIDSSKIENSCYW